MKTLIALLLSTAAVFAGTNDVRLYMHAPNPQGMPTNWPANVQPYKDGEVLPPLQTNWQRLSDEQLATLRANALPAFNAWAAARESAITTLRTDREQLITDTIADIDFALANWNSITNLNQQKLILRRVVVIVRAILKDELK